MTDRALPNLVTRMLLDRSQFKAEAAASVVDINAIRVAAEVGGGGLGKLGAGHGIAAAAAVKHGQEVRTLENSVKAMDKTVGIAERTLSSLGGTAESKLGSAARGLSSSFGGLGPVGAGIGVGLGSLAAAAGVIALLDHLASSQADFAFKTLQSSQALGENEQHYQTIIRYGEKYGIDQDTNNTLLFRFNKNLGENAPLLKAQGVSLAELGITSKDTYTAYLQTADALSRMDDAGQKAIVTQALFGRGGEVQLEALQHGRQAIVDFNKSLEDYGVILNHDQLQTAASAKLARDELGLALQGLENQFVAPLEQGFAELDIVMSQAAKNGKSGFSSLGETLGYLIGALASFIDGISGGTGSQEIFNKAQKEAATGVQANNLQLTLGKAAAKDYQAQIDALREATTLKTRALAEDVKGLEASKTAYDALIDDKIRAEQASIKEYDEEIRLIDLRRQTARDTEKIAKDSAAVNKASFEGDFKTQQQLSETLNQDIQTQQDDTAKAAINGHKDEAQARIDGYTEAKRIRDADYASQIKQIQDTSTDLQNQASDEEKRLGDLAKAAGAPGDALGAGMDAGFTAAGVALNGFTLKFDAGAEHWGKTIRDALGGDKKAQAELERLAEGLGNTIASHIGSGIVSGLSSINLFGVALAFDKIGGAILLGTVQGMRNAVSKIPGAGPILDVLGIGSGGDAAIKNLWGDLQAGASGSSTVGKGGQSGGYVGSSGKPAGRAFGGPVLPHTDYLVGETGPEILRMGAAGGTVVPDLGGGQTVVMINIPNLIYGNKADAEKAMSEAAEAAFGKLANRR